MQGGITLIGEMKGKRKREKVLYFYSLFYTCPKKNETIIIESDLAFDRFFKCVDRREREKDKQSQLISIIYYWWEWKCQSRTNSFFLLFCF